MNENTFVPKSANWIDVIAVPKLITLLAAFAVFSFGSLSTVAQTEDEEGRQASTEQPIEVIIVTAEKREENILEVPLTVTGFNDQLLEELGMTRTDDLEQLVPGLQFGDNLTKGGQGTVIRGIGTQNWGVLQGNQAVATYIDGIYHTTQIAISDAFFDLERVEVARGPQGTLNGRNSIAGSIALHSKRPQPEWDLDVLSELTDRVSTRLNVAFGGPLLQPLTGDSSLAFRLTGTYHEGDGAQENLGSGPDYDAPDRYSFRPQLRFTSERWDINLAYNELQDRGSTRTPVLLRQPPTDTATMCFSWRDPTDPRSRDPDDPLYICNESGNNYTWYLYETPLPSAADCPPHTPANRCDKVSNKILANRDAIEVTDREGVSVHIDFDLSDSWMVRYTYGTTTLDQFGTNDGDRTAREGHPDDASVPRDCVDAGRSLAECKELFPNGFSDSRQIWPYTNDEASHELHAVSTLDGPLNFIVGLYSYEGTTTWKDGGHSFGHVWRFNNSDQTAQNLGFADCAAFFQATIAPLLTDPNHWLAEESFRTFTCAPGTDHRQRWGSGSGSIQETTALFGSFDYQFNDLWAISGGLRYTEDENFENFGDDFFKFAYCSDQACRDANNYVVILGALDIIELFGRPINPPADCGLECIGRSQKWDAVIWNGNIEYRPRENLLWYGRISTGYRAGGLPSPTASFLPPVEEETVINYELGIKGLFLDDRLQLVTSGWLNDYDGYQVSAIMDAAEAGFPQAIRSTRSNPLMEFTTNVDGTSVYGIDVEWSYVVNENWRAGGYYAYLDSKLGTFSTVVIDDPNPTIAQWSYVDEDTGMRRTSTYIKPKDHSDGKLPQQAKHKLAVNLSYETFLDANRGVLQFMGIWSHTGDRYALVQNASSNLIPAYSRLDLRGTWVSPDEEWTTTLYVQNALDEIGFVDYIPGFRPDWAYNAAEGVPKGLLTESREIGLQVRWRP